MLAEVWPFVRASRAAGEPVVLARVVLRTGSAGRPIGATMAVTARGWTGSVAGGCVDGDVLTAAAAVLAGSPARMLRCDLGPEARPAWEAGPACRGSLGVLVAPLFDETVCSAVDLVLDTAPTDDLPAPVLLSTLLLPPYATELGAATGPDVVQDVVRPGPRLVLVGATDIAVCLASFASAAGFRVVVLEPRLAYAAADRVPDATLVKAWPDAWLADHPLGADDALVALTHEPRLDDAALTAALRTGCGYVAAIGSHATQDERLRRLAHLPDVGRIHGPAGLDLGGSSSAATALSVLSELVADRHGRSGGPLRNAPGPVHGA